MVNYDVPTIPEDYVHCIGRTGRAGVSGIAISLVNRSEKVHLKAIEKLIHQKIPVEKISGYTDGSELVGFLNPGSQNAPMDKEVKKAIKEFAARKKTQKQKPDKSKTKTKDSGKSSKPESKKRSGSKRRKIPSPSRSRSRQSSKRIELPRRRRRGIRPCASQ